MSTKQIVQDLLQHMPEDVSLREVAQGIEFIAGVREGFASYNCEGGVTTQEAKAQVSIWVKEASK